MRGWGLFFFLILVVAILGAVGWVAYTQIKARREGLPPPSWKSYVPFMKKSAESANYPTPRARGAVEWVRDQIDKLRNRGTRGGAYEESRDTPGGAGGYSRAGDGRGGRGRGRAAEDDAWDTQVSGVDDPYSGGHGYGNEEAEMGLGSTTTGLHNEPYGGHSDYMAHSSTGYKSGATVMGDRERSLEDPFSDQHDAGSLRSMSPRPTGADPPRSSKKSAFHEDM